MFTPSLPQAMTAAVRAMAALEGFEPRDPIAAGGWVALAVLGALRSRFEQTPEKRQAFDTRCGQILAWLRREIEALRFEKAH